MAKDKMKVEEVIAEVKPTEENMLKKGIAKGKAIVKKHWKKGVALVATGVGIVLVKNHVTSGDDDVRITMYDDGSYTVEPSDTFEATESGGTDEIADDTE